MLQVGPENKYKINKRNKTFRERKKENLLRE